MTLPAKKHKFASPLFLWANALWFVTSQATAGEITAYNCASRHIRKAIELNLERSEQYATVSSGRTRWISRKLLFLERLSLPSAQLMDLLSRRWQVHDIPVACDDFVSMSAAPRFIKYDPSFALLNRADDPLPDFGALAGRLKASRKISFEELARSVDREITATDQWRARLCMTKHILESIRRSAQLAPVYQSMAEAEGLESPRWISEILIASQITLLGEAGRIDASLRPIHAAGIPMVCRDVPYIPPFYNESSNSN